MLAELFQNPDQGCLPALRLGIWNNSIKSFRFQVKLTLQKLSVETPKPPPPIVKKNNIVNGNLVKLVSGERLNTPRPTLKNTVHGAMYLTLDCSQEAAQTKVGENETQFKLFPTLW